MAGQVVETTARIVTDYGPNTIRTVYWEEYRGKGKDGKALPAAWMGRVQAAPGSHKTGGDPHIAGRALDIVLRASEPNEKRIAEELVQVFLKLKKELKFISVIYNSWEWNGSGQRFPRGGDAINRHVSHIHIEWSESDMNHGGFDEILAGEVSNISDVEIGGVEDDAKQASFFRPYSS